MPIILRCMCGNFILAAEKSCEYCGEIIIFRDVKSIMRCEHRRIVQNQDIRWKKDGKQKMDNADNLS